MMRLMKMMGSVAGAMYNRVPTRLKKFSEPMIYADYTVKPKGLSTDHSVALARYYEKAKD
jgi:hypothetical protein